MPEFLFCEFPVKNGSIHDNRMFIYCSRHISLIEVIPLEDMQVVYETEHRMKQFSYTGPTGEEDYLLVITQNNLEKVTSEIEAIQGVDHAEKLLSQAWLYFENYLKWEDKQV